MASYTTNLNLKKPAGSENVAIGDINNNMDLIDQAYGTLNSNMTAKSKFSKYTFSGEINNNEYILTNCPLSSIPIGIIGDTLTRSGWTYSFIYHLQTSSANWCIRVDNMGGSAPTGSFGGTFVALNPDFVS